MSKAVQKIEVASPPASPNEAAAIFHMIERMATDPSVPVERFEQTFSFYQKVQADQARREFAAAFAAMQPELPAVERKGTGHNAKKYARWEDIAGAIMPILARHGFGLRFAISDADKSIRVTCILSHRSGHYEETSATFPHDASGSKNAIQAIGSAKTYGQRYTATAILGIATRDEDDDGGAACASETISGEQAEELSKLISATGTDLAKFLQVAKAESVSDVLSKDYARLTALLLKKRAQK